MRFRISDFGFRICLTLFLFPAIASADSSALILSGLPGSPAHAEKFAKWTESTRKILVEELGFSPDRVLVLADKKTTKADIEGAFKQLSKQLKPDDAFFLFLIGHGSYDADAGYKFQISGPDLTGADYSKLLLSLDTERIVIVNSTPASEGSFEALGGKGRVVIAAARAREANDTVFYEHFLKGLEKAAGDEDKDKKVSVWEAFKYASASVERFYKDQPNRLATEHPSLSDGGAKGVTAGVAEPPVIARTISFHVDRPVTVADARLQTLLNEKAALDKKIETLRINRASMAAADYEKQLEELVVQLALKNQEIREREKQIQGQGKQ